MNNSNILSMYFNECFNMVKLKDKSPLEMDWTNKEHRSPKEWVEWLDKGFNMGVRTGKSSNITVIDIDQEVVPDELLSKLNTTLVGKTNKGWHYYYTYEPELPVTRIEELKVDILNDGRQVVVPPSVVNGMKREWFNTLPISSMSPELKDYLLDKTAGKAPNNPISLDTHEIEEGNRNNTLVHLGGIIRQWSNPEQTAKTMWLINQRFVHPPLHRREVEAMAKSLERYSEQEFTKLEDKIYAYLQITDSANIHDIKDFTKEVREKLDIALYNLITSEKILKQGNKFSVLKKVSWRQDFNVATGERVNFKVPYFEDVANFCWGDMVLIGGKPSVGKTTIAMNIAKQLKVQGKIPYYINLETGSRFGRTAERLGMNVGDINWTTSSNPKTIEIEKGVITIIDWLMVEDKCETDLVFKYFTEQLQKKGGFLFLFQQLKDNNDFFAPNLAKQFPSFACRYIYDNEEDNRIFGSFKIDKNREPKGQWTSNIACKYDHETMLLEEVNAYAESPIERQIPKELENAQRIFGGDFI